MSAPVHSLARVLCATDLSDLGNRAIPLACAITAEGGELVLLHALHTPAVPSPLVPHYGERHASEAELAEQARERGARLEQLGAPAARARGLALAVRVVRAADVAAAILAEAERSRADAICLATHARTGLAELVLGSTAHEVLHRAGRPVLLVPSPVSR